MLVMPSSLVRVHDSTSSDSSNCAMRAVGGDVVGISANRVPTTVGANTAGPSSAKRSHHGMAPHSASFVTVSVSSPAAYWAVPSTAHDAKDGSHVKSSSVKVRRPSQSCHSPVGPASTTGSAGAPESMAEPVEEGAVWLAESTTSRALVPPSERHAVAMQAQSARNRIMMSTGVGVGERGRFSRPCSWRAWWRRSPVGASRPVPRQSRPAARLGGRQSNEPAALRRAGLGPAAEST